MHSRRLHLALTSILLAAFAVAAHAQKPAEAWAEWASLSGIKSDPAQYTEFARFNSYIDAFKSYFPAKVRSKETLMKMILVSSRPFHGHTGRSYKLTLGDLNGSVNAFVTRKRFYAIVSLNTKKDDALEEKFLSSFELPERQPDQPKTTAAAEGDGSVNNQGRQPG